jgi:succinyl-diaminopimelate desuccinylase
VSNQAAALLTHIDPEAIARDALDFVAVRSETGAEGPGSEFLAALLEREGFAVTRDEVEPGRPNIQAWLRGTGAGRRLLFNGHTDTIPIGRSTPPGRDGDWIVGRGAEDMKGGLVAMVHAASALRKAGVALAGDVGLSGVIGHETPVGKKEGPRRLIQQLNNGTVQADAIVIVEGPCALWTASLGSMIYHVTIASPQGQIHTIQVPFLRNPALWVGRVLTAFEAFEQQFALAPAHPLCGREQLNVGIVAAGDYPNRLPTPARITGTWRWTPGKTQAQVLGALQALCEDLARESGLTITCEAEAAREPFETPLAHPIVQAFDAAGQQVLGAPVKKIGMALVGDANLYANEAGVPTVYYGPAYQTAHSDDERVSVTQLAHCARMYALAALAFCGAPEAARMPSSQA